MITLKFNEIDYAYRDKDGKMHSHEKIFECEGVYAYEMIKSEKWFYITYSFKDPDEKCGISNNVIYSEDCTFIELNGKVIWEQSKKEAEKNRLEKDY